MSKMTFSKASEKGSKAELVVDRKVVDQAYINAENPIVFFSAEFVDMNDADSEEKINEKIRECNIRRARAMITALFNLMAKIVETDLDAVEELLGILKEAVDASSVSDPEDETQA